MVKNSGYKKKRLLLKVADFCGIAAAAFLYLVFAFDVYSSRKQSYKNHEKYIDRIVASSLKIKDPNKLTSEDLEKVTNIDISCNVERNLNPVARLKNLDSIRLEIAPNRNIDLRPLAKLKHLNRVELNIMPKQRIDLKPLAGLKSLKTLQVEFPGTYSKKSRWYEKFLALMKTSRMSGLTNIVTIPFDLGQLARFKNIEKLKVQTDKASNIEALAGLRNLKNLYLEFLQGQVIDVRPLSDMVNLEYLGLDNAEIKDINLLANLKNLQELDLSNAKVTNLNALKKLTGLKSLNLRNVPISDDEIAELQKALPGLKIQR